MPSIGPSRSRRICDKCEGLLARILSTRQSSPGDVMHLEHIGHRGDCLCDPRLAGPIRRAYRDERRASSDPPRRHRFVPRTLDDRAGLPACGCVRAPPTARGPRAGDVCLGDPLRSPAASSELPHQYRRLFCPNPLLANYTLSRCVDGQHDEYQTKVTRISRHSASNAGRSRQK